MPARKAGAGEIGIAIHRNTATTQREARDQIAGSGIGIRPGERLAAHLFQIGNAGIGAHHHHRDVGNGAIRFLGGQQRLNPAIGIKPGAGIARRTKPCDFNLLRAEGLQHTGIIRSREKPGRHTKGAFQQITIGAETAHAISFILTAQQANAKLRHLFRPRAAARCGEGFGEAFRTARGPGLCLGKAGQQGSASGKRGQRTTGDHLAISCWGDSFQATAS